MSTDNDYVFNSRRSPVISTHGLVSTNQPLATQIGIDILKAGGNAADAAVAVAAALNVTEPCSTGIGGDAFCLFYNSKTKTVKGLNGSGRSSSLASLESYQSLGYTQHNPLPMKHALTVTVPGAASAWVDTVQTFGSGNLSLSQILQPAINLAENGYPVHQTVAHFWDKGSQTLKNIKNVHGKDMLLNGEAPGHGDIMKLPKLAETFKELAKHGKKGFYEGRVAQSIVDVVTSHGGFMTLEDLASHKTTFEEPISVDYKGHRVWEIAPNGQGLVALMALNILDGFNLKDMGHNSTEYLHVLIEALKISFADGLWFIADQEKANVPVKQLLSKSYAATRRNLLNTERALEDISIGSPCLSSDTVYFSIVDKEGNACSFIISNFMGFGTGLIPEGCGFTLQNRGFGFSLDPTHPNKLEPSKRPFHTIIPAMVTSVKTVRRKFDIDEIVLCTYDETEIDDYYFSHLLVNTDVIYAKGKSETGDLLCSYGVMGGFMQPQGHVQVLLNMVEFGMNPQQAIDAPRFCIGQSYTINKYVSVEEGIPDETIRELKAKGHDIDGPIIGFDRSRFGRGHIITRGNWWRLDQGLTNTDTWWGGCDPRTDSVAIGY